jgi:tRNA G10  N-methylase Trm11
MGYPVYGTDLSDRMIEYSEKNLKWLKAKEYKVEQGDAMNFTWTEKIGAVACETYLGAPMSQPPVEIKLKDQKQECKRIVLGFLKNLSTQIEPKTPLAIAVPAWLRPDGHYERLNILDEIKDMGYNVEKLNHLSQEDMLYFRDGQIVAREIIVLRKK